jgi:hypothetical protein
VNFVIRACLYQVSKFFAPHRAAPNAPIISGFWGTMGCSFNSFSSKNITQQADNSKEFAWQELLP